MLSSRSAQSQPDLVERLSVDVRRGYVSTCFFARRLGTGEVVHVSPTFRAVRFPWAPRLPLETTPKAVAALRELESSLLAEGWERCGHEPDAKWHECEFRRVVPRIP
jgi:hypothetical protein